MPKKVECTCVIKNRREGESQRDWMKRVMCMFHWIQTDYYQNKRVTISLAKREA